MNLHRFFSEQTLFPLFGDFYEHSLPVNFIIYLLTFYGFALNFSSVTTSLKNKRFKC